MRGAYLFELFKDERSGRTLVAVSLAQFEALTDMASKYSMMMEQEGKNTGGSTHQERVERVRECLL